MKTLTTYRLKFQVKNIVQSGLSFVFTEETAEE